MSHVVRPASCGGPGARIAHPGARGPAIRTRRAGGASRLGVSGQFLPPLPDTARHGPGGRWRPRIAIPPPPGRRSESREERREQAIKVGLRGEEKPHTTAHCPPALPPSASPLHRPASLDPRPGAVRSCSRASSISRPAPPRRKAARDGFAEAETSKSESGDPPTRSPHRNPRRQVRPESLARIAPQGRNRGHAVPPRTARAGQHRAFFSCLTMELVKELVKSLLTHFSSAAAVGARSLRGLRLVRLNPVMST